MSRARRGDTMTAMPRPLRILFHSPQIPNNTGATMRLAAVTGAELHLARPLGFDMDDAKLRRAGLDYRDEAATFVHDSLAAAYGALLPARVFAFTAHAEDAYTDVVLPRPETFSSSVPNPRDWPLTCWPILASPSACVSRCGPECVH